MTNWLHIACASTAFFVFLFSNVAQAEEVCHSTTAGDQFTLEVPSEDVSDHIGHGDTLGPCDSPQVEVPYTCSTSTIIYEKLFVRSGATRPMNGTVDRPFPTVSAALDYAARKRFSAVEIQVAPAVYGSDSVDITRPTRIVGPGRDAVPTAELALSIDHRSTHELGIQGVLFRPNGLEPGLTVRTHAMPDDPSGHTALCNIGYENIVGHAVAQLGGSISADDIIVRNTRRYLSETPRNVLSGTGFIFGGGLGGSIDALLENSFVFDSEGTGIVASGFRTTVTLNAVALSGGQGCFGGLFVDNVAEVFGSHVRIGGVRLPEKQQKVCPDDTPECVTKYSCVPDEDELVCLGVDGLDHVGGQPVVLTGNRQSGVYAGGSNVLAGADTFVGMTDLIVRNTFSTDADSEECGFDAASSLFAGTGADIVVDKFILDASDLVAVQIDGTGSIITDPGCIGDDCNVYVGSTIFLSNGVVSNNPITWNIQNAEYPLTTLQNDVLYINNDVELDAEKFSIPQPEKDLDSL